jgi:hypothetical protein
MCKNIQKNETSSGTLSPFGTGKVANVSARLAKYISSTKDKEKRILKEKKHLWFDSIFESGNLLSA